MTGKTFKAEYIWLDGAQPTAQLRSKTKLLALPDGEVQLSDFEDWGYDGSSTYQASGHDSDLILKPVSFVKDPVRGAPNYMVMCEVFNPDGTPHASNTRAALRALYERGAAAQEPWAGFEQEYTFFKGGRPLGWPESGYPAPQGPFYCSVGANVAFGRNIVEEHMDLCMKAELSFYGVNAEVMPGQWEFQIGYRGIKGETADALTMADQLWIGRYLLSLVAEKYGVTVSFEAKPVKGDWNGAGMHTNFSTNDIRHPKTGMAAIEKAIQALGPVHREHIAEYGANNHERLTGHHETCSINEFRSGVANRGCSIRIPRGVEQKGYGYFEDRRPAANADPYRVARMLVQTVCMNTTATKTQMPRREFVAEL
jgi:glutamine synthetase